jgi:lipopolysaccharide export LptBFGC system permease protein LptF
MDPLSALPLVLMAIPLAMTSPRKLNNFGFLTSIGILFFYYVVRDVSNQFGNSGKLIPLLASALPIVIILAIAGTLFYRKNRVL